jgi:hypothetical protein
MSDHSRFFFEKEFVPGEPHPDDVAASMVDPADVPVYSQRQVDTMLADARNEGSVEAMTAAKEDTGAFAAQTMEYIAQQMDRLGTFQDSIVQVIHKEAVELASLIGSKLARKLMAREPKAEVDALITEMLRQFTDVGIAPRVIVHVHPILHEDISANIAVLKSRNAFSGEITVLEGEGFGPTDCSVEWASGGARRDVKALEEEVKATIDRYLAAIDAGTDPVIAEITPEQPAAQIENNPAVTVEPVEPDQPVAAEVPVAEVPVADAQTTDVPPPVVDEGPSVIDAIAAEAIAAEAAAAKAAVAETAAADQPVEAVQPSETVQPAT